MATDPDEKVAADAPSDATLSVTLSEEKEEDAVEDTQVDILEEDDDFEEFKEDQWDQSPLNADEQVEWEDNWDDEEHDDDFAKRLRAEIAANDKPAS